jgi:hypothetical protein
VIVRVDHKDGRQTETTVPAIGRDDAEYEDLARGLLAGLPGVSRVRVWADGLSFFDEPTADVSAADAGAVVAPSDDVLDIATALTLTQGNDQEGPPAWLRRGCTPVRPGTLPGRRPASGSLPPV